jgi:hypothetical protein
MTVTEIPAFIPEIEGLVQGANFDIATSLSETHSNEFTTHPIEDPKRSFLMDHTREAPAELSVTIEVTTTPLHDRDVTVSEGQERIVALHDRIMAMRAAQSVDTSAFLRVYTGLRTFHNMAIKSVTFTRDPARPTTEVIDLQLQEFRFARSPRATNAEYLMDANDGPRDDQNKPLVLPAFQPLVEGTVERGSPHLPWVEVIEERLISQATHALGLPALTRFGINRLTGGAAIDPLANL